MKSHGELRNRALQPGENKSKYILNQSLKDSLTSQIKNEKETSPLAPKPGTILHPASFVFWYTSDPSEFCSEPYCRF